MLSHDSILYAALILLRRFPIGCQLAFCFTDLRDFRRNVLSNYETLTIAADVAAG